MLWVPENLEKVLIPNYVVTAMTKPWLYDQEKGSVDFRRAWIIIGRPGLNIAEGTMHCLLTYKGSFVSIAKRAPLDHAAHYKFTEDMDEIIDTQVKRLTQVGQINGTTGLVLVIDRAHVLMTSKDPYVTQWVANLVERIQGLHTIVLLCTHASTRQMPEDMRITYQYQGVFHYVPPTPQWVEQYLRFTLVTSFKPFLDAHRDELQPITFELTDDDYKFLTECCDYVTTSELYEFCNLIKTSLHRPRTSEGEIVCNLAYCKHFLKNVGGCLRISEVNGYEAMQGFWDCAKEGYPDPPKRSEATITNKAEYLKTSGHASQEIQNPFASSIPIPESIVVSDPNKGVLIKNPYVEEEPEEPTKKRRLDEAEAEN